MTKHKTPLHTLVQDAPDLRDSTRKLYLRDIDTYVDVVGPHPQNWTRPNTAKFYKHLLATGMKPQSANRLMASIRYASRWYASHANDDKLDFCVIQLAPGSGKAAREQLTEEQVTRMLDTCARKKPRDLRDIALIVTAVETGMRRMSLVDMAVENIGKEPYPYIAVKLKGRDDRYKVPLSDTALLAMKPWLSFLKKHEGSDGKRGKIVRSINHVGAIGDGMTKEAVYGIVRARGDDAGIGHVHPHTFRHTFVTWRVTQGLSPFQIASITGHRLPGDGAGSLYNYADKKALGEVARQATPEWLASYVRAYV